jgi:hypothetical protein
LSSLSSGKEEKGHFSSFFPDFSLKINFDPSGKTLKKVPFCSHF